MQKKVSLTAFYSSLIFNNKKSLHPALPRRILEFELLYNIF